MLAQSEKKILWHPRGENKFIVGGGSQITMYEWSPEEPAIRHITSQQDIAHMKCFAWSPEPQYNDIVAVGQSSGHVNLLRLESNRYGHDRVLKSGPNVQLPPRNTRSCLALAFSPVAPQYLAVGLDKVRGDPSLVVWDVSTVTATLSSSNPSPSSLNHPPTAPPPSPARPPFSLLPSPSSPSRPYATIPRGDFNARMDSRILQAHQAAESVHTVAWLPNTPHLLAAGVSHRWLRILDLRSATSAVTSVAARVQAVTPDPCSPYRVATAGDNVVHIWDVRKPTAALMIFSCRDAVGDGARPRGAPIAEMEFSTVRHGTLSTLLKDASDVRFWDILTSDAAPVSPQLRSAELPGEKQSMRTPKLSWSNPTSMLPWGGGGSNASASVAPPLSTTTSQGDQQVSATQSVILADTRITKKFASPIVSYCLMPNVRQHPLTSSLITVTKEGDLEAASLHDIPTHAPWSSRGSLIISAATNYRVFHGIPPGDKPQEPWAVTSSEPEDRLGVNQLFVPPKPEHNSAITGGDDLSVIGRGRAKGQPTPRSGATTPAPATFGRGDEDGFPALSAPQRSQSNNPATASPGPSQNRDYGLRAPPTRYVQDRSVHSTFHSLPSSPLVKAGKLADMPPSEVFSRPSSALRSTSGHPAEAELGLGIIDGTKTKKDKEVFMAKAKSAGKIKKKAVERIQSVVEEDISMVMRKRVAEGYSLASPSRNAAVLMRPNEKQDDNRGLIELWRWIDHSRPLLSAPISSTNFYDFSYQGVLGIWEGFPRNLDSTVKISSSETSAVSRTNSELLDPLNNLNEAQPISRSRSGRGRDRGQRAELHEYTSAITALFHLQEMDLNIEGGEGAWVPATHTKRLVQRKLALMVCGWNLREESIASRIAKWEKDGKWSQAACWLVFIGKIDQAIDLLMRSKDESHHMLSGTLAGLVPSSSNKSSTPDALRAHCERLIVRLQDPYFRAMLTHLILRDWSDVLEEDSLPLQERLAIALQFHDDESLTAYLRRVADRAIDKGYVEGLAVTGLTTRGMDLLQTYVDLTGDVQTAAILGTTVHPHKVKDQRAEKWVETYKDLLDGWKMFHHRCQLDIERGEMVQELVRNGDAEMDPIAMGLVPRQVLIRCNFCSKVISAPQGSLNVTSAGPAACPFCGRSLPRCSICLMHLTIIPDSVRDSGLVHHNASLRDTMEDAIVFCQTCRHGGHAAHILDWFYGESGERSHGLCPVADCKCRCSDEF